jgi:tRNA(Ile)-lysidine synthase
LATRFFRPGDRIRPLGLGGSRKIQDVFVDHKIAVASRLRWPLVVSGDEVIWIPGLVRSRLALVSAASRKVVHLRADSLPHDLKVRLPEL